MRRGGGEPLFKMFKPPPPIGEVILQTIRKLEIQKVKLEQVKVRLQRRDHALFEACVVHIRKNSHERAAICASELAEVRRLRNMVVQCQLALERVILRLETIREVSEIFAELRPALKTLRGLTQTLVNVLPNIAMELEKVNESITETLVMTRMNDDLPLPMPIKTEAGEEILKEASAFLEEKLSKQLPEPPEPTRTRVIVREKPARQPEKVKQMVALAVSCSEVVQHKDKGENQRYVSYKDMELREVSVTTRSSSSLEDTMLEYIKKCKGEIDIKECALQLNIPPGEVLKALKNLGAKGKIQILR
jgi:division protein CdvB (Snf7/Vps24/ESCRT-III family)